jgi:chromosome segregation ATPase
VAEDVASLTYELLKRMQTQFSRFEDGLADLKTRVPNMESGLSLVRQELALQSLQISQLSHRMDRFDERLARIERRLDLIEA